MRHNIVPENIKTMGNSGSSGGSGNSGVCTGKNAPGLNQHCYTTGYDHARPNSTPDAVGESLGAAPCLSNANANKCYAQGFQDGHRSSSHNTTSYKAHPQKHQTSSKGSDWGPSGRRCRG